ncbi:Peptidoglycan/xylan/chitin deacetylase, PgdA/CDA1 family [Alicyclobacillus hesperidum]|uniref:Peptidoglycan/xylan/chitin deacetylase, PgdA/CDA1 family n=1 Tax=Alicyclobacillus hesperidum TaxID=89784 RepID=A0A1H2W2P8_9BACL|nr:polysaccharide deacetylase family protein [Alicyclobacillus hesperidum]SDW74821.1 Peptidoglycan/xylan/chitin deacetylase, PgdA/CDA1 family [Alicyclobacillus hesperidum]
MDNSRTRQQTPARVGTLTITFDDGPDAEYTPQILETLRHYGVPAVFFCIGEQVARYPDVLRAIDAAGHAIGNHTMTHPHLTELPNDEIRKQLTDAANQIEATIGKRPHLFRPPYGDMDERVERIARELGYQPVLWDVDSVDWSGIPGPTVAANVLPHLKPGAIVLQHAGEHAEGTPAALPYIIEVAVAMGYDWVPFMSKS